MDNTKLFGYKISSIIEIIVRVIAGIVMGYLTLSCIFTTVYISEYENVYFCSDNPIINVAIIILSIIITAVCYRLAECKPMLRIKNKHLNIIILGVYFFLLLYIVISSMLSPTLDQYKVVHIANQMCNYDYSGFIKGGYGYECNNQWGIILFFYGLMRIFGENNTLILQIVNIIAMVGFVFFFAEICDRLFDGPKKTAIIVASCLLLPTWFYSTFIYGTYLSLFFAVLSFYFAILYYSEEELTKGSAAYCIISGICMSLSIQFKSNTLIFLIALIVYLIVLIIRDKRWRKLLVIGWLLFAVFAGGKIVNKTMSDITGVPLGEGMPYSTYIAMGLQENSGKTSGWYNGFNDQTYELCGYDYAETNRISVDSINESISDFKSNPKGAIGFFSRKTISQWIEPTFGSVYILLNRQPLYNSKWIDAITDNKLGNSTYLSICNYIQTIIYFGAFIGIIGRIKKKNETVKGFYEVLPLITVLGGFFFHMIWEAKSQYILPYYVLLVPYTLLGYRMCATTVNECISHESNKKARRAVAISFMIFAAVFAIGCAVPAESNIGLLFKPGRSSEEYRLMRYENEKSKSNGVIKDGLYNITNYDGESLCVGDDGEYNENGNGLPTAGTKLICTKDAVVDNTNAVRITSSNGGYVLRFQITQLVADVECGSTEAGARLQQWDYNGDPSQTFRIEKCEDESFVIRYLDNLAFTCDENGNVYVDEISADNVYQKWYISEL